MTTTHEHTWAGFHYGTVVYDCPVRGCAWRPDAPDDVLAEISERDVRRAKAGATR